MFGFAQEHLCFAFLLLLLNFFLCVSELGVPEVEICDGFWVKMQN